MSEMTPLERVLTAVKHETPDRVPIFILMSTIGAKMSGLAYKDYYTSGENIAQMQIKLQQELGYDCLLGLSYIAQEVEPFGTETMFFNDGDPNIGRPVFLDNPAKFIEVEVPDPYNDPSLKESLELMKKLAEFGKGKIPIIGVSSGAFSFPSLLCGTKKWFDLLLLEPEKSKEIIKKSEEFVIRLANAKIESGADVTVLVDGLATAAAIPPEIFNEFVKPSLTRIVKEIKGPVVFGNAGGEVEPLMDLISETGVLGTFLCSNDDLESIKAKHGEKLLLLGNINNIEIIDWPDSVIDSVVKKCIEDGANNGGYVLMNQHTFTTDFSLERIKFLISKAKEYGKYH